MGLSSLGFRGSYCLTELKIRIPNPLPTPTDSNSGSDGANSDTDAMCQQGRHIVLCVDGSKCRVGVPTILTNHYMPSKITARRCFSVLNADTQRQCASVRNSVIWSSISNLWPSIANFLNKTERKSERYGTASVIDSSILLPYIWVSFGLSSFGCRGRYCLTQLKIAIPNPLPNPTDSHTTSDGTHSNTDAVCQQGRYIALCVDG